MCVKQLLSIIHQLYNFFDDCQEVWSLFSDILKVLYKEYCKGLIFKLNQNGISGDTVNTVSDFLKPGKHWVVVDVKQCQLSSWSNLEAGVPARVQPWPLLTLRSGKKGLMNLFLAVGWYVSQQFFLKVAHVIFLKFNKKGT